MSNANFHSWYSYLPVLLIAWLCSQRSYNVLPRHAQNNCLNLKVSLTRPCLLAKEASRCRKKKTSRLLSTLIFASQRSKKSIHSQLDEIYFCGWILISNGWIRVIQSYELYPLFLSSVDLADENYGERQSLCFVKIEYINSTKTHSKLHFPPFDRILASILSPVLSSILSQPN